MNLATWMAVKRKQIKSEMVYFAHAVLRHVQFCDNFANLRRIFKLASLSILRKHHYVRRVLTLCDTWLEGVRNLSNVMAGGSFTSETSYSEQCSQLMPIKWHSICVTGISETRTAD
jgi:hypothetical protein